MSSFIGLLRGQCTHSGEKMLKMKRQANHEHGDRSHAKTDEKM